MISATNDGVDPPDKNENITHSINETIFTNMNNKNSRPRESDDDAVFESPAKNAKTTNVGDLQRKASLTLLRKSILDMNPFAILDPDENADDLADKESKNINAKQFSKIYHSGKNTPKQRIPPVTITKPFKNPKDAISNIQLKEMLTSKS